MSVAMKRCVREHSASQGNVRFLLFILADYTAKGSDHAFPSLRLLRQELGIFDVRGVRRIIRRAERLGELVVESGGGRDIDGKYRLTRYYVRCGIGSSHVSDEEPAKGSPRPPLPHPSRGVPPDPLTVPINGGTS